MLNDFVFDFWTLWGLCAQGLFFLRFVIQWYFSEKAKKTVVPKSFWYISLFASVMIIIYALARKDVVFLITGLLQIVVYIRSLIIAKNDQR